MSALRNEVGLSMRVSSSLLPVNVLCNLLSHGEADTLRTIETITVARERADKHEVQVADMRPDVAHLGCPVPCNFHELSPNMWDLTTALILPCMRAVVNYALRATGFRVR